jgi:queuine tRNA-ribosyltransferase
MLGPQLASLQNLSFYLSLVKQARERIIDGSFVSWKNTMVQKLNRKL